MSDIKTIKAKIEEVTSMKLLNWKKRRTDFDWNQALAHLAEVLILMHYQSLYNSDVMSVIWDKQRYFYYDICTSSHNNDGKYSKISQSQRDIIKKILEEVDCSTYVE